MAGFSRKDEKFREYALNGPIYKVLISTCAPLALYQALQQIFKILDSMMASHISADSVSAVACLAQITLILTAIGSGLAVGGCIKISEAYGQGDHELVRRRTATLYAMCTVASLAVVLVLVPFAVPFLRLLNTPEELITTGVGYFRVEILSMVVSFFNTVYIAIERSRGHARKILRLNFLVIAIKLGLSALFVYILHSGVIMIAVATLLSQTVLLAIALYGMAHDEGAFRFSFSAITLDRRTTLPILNLAYPVSAEKMLFAFGKVVVNSMSGLYGKLTVGALGISNNIGGLTTSWHAGMLDGASALISQNRGAGKYRRSLHIFYRLVAVDLGFSFAGLVMVFLFLPQLAAVFAHSSASFNQEFCDMIIRIHQYEMLGYITLGINSAVLALLLGYGYTKLTLILNVARVFVFRVPVLWYLQTFTDMGVEAVGVTMMVSNICAGVSAVLVAIPVILQIRKKALGEKDAPTS